jgi:chromate reductase, NAD(P)H dehydrogenase (quinone)
MDVLGFSGSLRKGSFNSMALRAAQKLAPEGMRIEIADLAPIPIYNEDVRTAGLPDSVAALKERIRAADAILLVSPEFNFSVPAVMKNMLDWMSRPPAPPFDGKPVAIMGASTGILGTARMQYHMRQILVYMNTFTVNKPEVFITLAAAKFNAEGDLTDAPTAQVITDLLVSLRTLAQRVKV